MEMVMVMAFDLLYTQTSMKLVRFHHFHQSKGQNSYILVQDLKFALFGFYRYTQRMQDSSIPCLPVSQWKTVLIKFSCNQL